VPPDDEPETIKDTLQIPPFGTPGQIVDFVFAEKTLFPIASAQAKKWAWLKFFHRRLASLALIFCQCHAASADGDMPSESWCLLSSWPSVCALWSFALSDPSGALSTLLNLTSRSLTASTGTARHRHKPIVTQIRPPCFRLLAADGGIAQTCL